MPPLTPQELDTFLREGTHLAKIATLKSDGYPYINPVWYEYDGTYIYIIARARSQFLQHIRHDNRVAVCIDTSTAPYKRVLFEGIAEIIDQDWVEMGKRMALRYRGAEGLPYIEATRNRPRAMIRITPQRITSWQGGEWHRRYIDIEERG